MTKMNLITLLLFPVITGCVYVQPTLEPVGNYYLNPQADFSSVGKVVILEFENKSTHPAISGRLAETLAQSLQKTGVFNVGTLYQHDPAWQYLELEPGRGYDLAKLAAMRRQLKADAVLFGSVMHYQSYPRLSVGLKLKLVDLRDGKLLWAMDQFWDTTDKTIEKRIKRFFANQMRSGYDPMQWQLAITSPAMFNKFVVYEVAKTFPQNENSYRGNVLKVRVPHAD
ncbi:MAG: hypothetical protein ACYSUX_19440 [Planctomycetota bacterium]|jgi:hypothetical protein